MEDLKKYFQVDVMINENHESLITISEIEAKNEDEAENLAIDLIYEQYEQHDLSTGIKKYLDRDSDSVDVMEVREISISINQ